MFSVVSGLKRLYMHTFPDTKSTPPNVLEIHMQTASTLVFFHLNCTLGSKILLQTAPQFTRCLSSDFAAEGHW